MIIQRIACILVCISLFVLFCASFANAQWRQIDRLPYSYGSQLVFDEHRGVYVLLMNTSYFTTQLWEFNGKGWYCAADPGPESYGTDLLYFPPLQRVLIVGGGYANHTRPGTPIWSWDGKSVRLESCSGPERRLEPSLSYSPADRKLYLHGGNDGDTFDTYYYSDTWSWDGKEWLHINTMRKTDEYHYEYDLVYDIEQGNILLFDKNDYDRYDDNGVYKLAGNQWVRLCDRPNYTQLLIDPVSGTIVLWVYDSVEQLSRVWNWRDGALTPPVAPYDSSIVKGADTIAAGSDGTILAFGSGAISYFNKGWRHEPQRTDLRSAENHSTIVHDPVRDKTVFFGSQWSDFYEHDGVQWQSKGKLGREIDSAIFDPAKKAVLALTRLGDPALTRTRLWNGTHWKDIAVGEPNPLCTGFLVREPLTGDSYFCSNIDTAHDPFRAVVIWKLEQGSWRIIFKNDEPGTSLRHLLGATWDDAAQRLLLVFHSDEGYTVNYHLDGENLVSVPGSNRPTLQWTAIQQSGADGGMPWVLANSTGISTKKREARLFTWEHGKWRRGPIIAAAAWSFDRWATGMDEIRGLKLCLNVSSLMIKMYAYGPYPGPVSGSPGKLKEICLYDSGSRLWNGALRTGVVHANGILPFFGQFTKKGLPTRGVFAPFTGTWYLECNRGQFQFGRLGDQPVVGDYDGDGIDEIAVFRPATGEWLTPDRLIATVGGAGMTPVPADYDGDGKTDPAVYDARTGIWRFAGGKKVTLGNEDSWPVPADYDGDGRAEIAVWNRQTGVWKTLTKTLLTFGVVSDIPVPLDTDGDGRAEPTHYRPGTGEWFVNGAWRADREKYKSVVW